MKPAIIGAGAMGLLTASFLKKSGIDFVIYEKFPDIVSSIKNSGIKVINDCEMIKNDNINIDTNPAVLAGCRIIFLFIKSYSTEEAVKSIINYLDKDCIIVSLQNGIGNKELLLKYFNEDSIVYGTTSYGASKSDLNSLKFGGDGEISIGGKQKNNVMQVIEILKNAGFSVNYTDKPDKAVWIKAIINAGINPVASILSIPNGEILNNKYSLDIQNKIIHEAVNVANSIKIKLNEKEMISLTMEVCRKTSSNLCSMYQDIKNNRNTEIDYINGKIIDYGRQNSVPTPCNEIIFDIIKALEKA